MQKIKQKAYKALRWSEKYTKTDMVYLASGGFWLTIGQGVATISGLLLAIAFAHLLPAEIYGNYKYVLSIVAILSAFSLTGVSTAVIRGVSRGFDGILKFSFWENIRWGIIMISLTFFGFLYYFYNGNTTLAYSLLIAGSTYPLLQSASLYISYLNGKKEFKALAILNIFRSLIPAISIFTTIFLTDNLITIILVYSVSHTITSVALYFSTIKKFRPTNNLESNNLNFGKHLSVINILGTFSNNIENILLFHFYGGTQLAIYTFATALPKQFTFLKKTIQTIALPKLTQKTIPELQRIVPQKALHMFLLLLPIVILYIFSAPYLYKILFPQYIEAVLYSQILSLYVLLFPSLFFSQTLIAHTKKKELYIAGTILPIVQIVLLFILVPTLGIWGATITTLTIRVLNFIILLFLFKKL